jgi:hypothetical protein
MLAISPTTTDLAERSATPDASLPIPVFEAGARVTRRIPHDCGEQYARLGFDLINVMPPVDETDPWDWPTASPSR